jgi:hypothetical protein
MGILRTKSTAPTTAQERAQAASLDVANALSAFTDTLAVLDGAVVDLQIASEESHELADAHRRNAVAASQEAIRHAKVASAFRNLLGDAA